MKVFHLTVFYSIFTINTFLVKLQAHVLSYVTERPHHLDTISNQSTETSPLSNQSNCLCTADDVFVPTAQLFGRACGLISETLLYLLMFFGAI